jgi:Cu+-exporting ATPase
VSHKGEEPRPCCQGHGAERDQPEADAGPPSSSGLVILESPSGGDYICPMCPGVRSPGPASCPECGMALELEGAPPPASRLEYICPMHADVQQCHPGSCPECGMALEPVEVAVEEQNPELDSMTRRFWVALGLTLPVFVIAMSEMIPGRPLERIAPPRVWVWVQLVLTLPVVLGCGWPFFQRGYRSIVTRKPNMFTLIAIGTGVALGFSLAAVLVPGLFPSVFQRADGSVAVYF